jgi:hypothetical protein
MVSVVATAEAKVETLQDLVEVAVVVTHQVVEVQSVCRVKVTLAVQGVELWHRVVVVVLVLLAVTLAVTKQAVPVVSD